MAQAPRMRRTVWCTAQRRVRSSLDAGAIERQVALLSLDRPGAGLSAIVEIQLDRQGAEHRDAFEQRTARALISSSGLPAP